jgi:hypothetical protein
MIAVLRADTESDARDYVPLIAFGFAVIVHILAMWGNEGPVLYEDALGYIGNARTLSGGAVPTFDGSGYYAGGYSLLLVPIYLVTQNSEVVWHYVVALNVIAASLIVFPAAWISRRLLGLSKRNAWIAAVAASLTPALILQPGRGWIETVFPLVYLIAVGAIYATLTHNRFGASVVSATSLGFLVLLHGRGAVIALVAIVVFIAAPATVGTRLRNSATVLVGIAAGFVISALLKTYLVSNQWTGGLPRNSDSVGEVLDAFSPDQIGVTLLNVVGHTWYVIVVSLGVAVAGFVCWIGIARQRDLEAVDRAKQLAAVFVLLSVSGTIIVSAAFLSGGPRPDHLVYGRYGEGVTPILILGGAAMIIMSRRAFAWMLAGGGLGLLLGAVLVVLRPADAFIGAVQGLSVPGLLGLEFVASRTRSSVLGGLSIVLISTVAGAFAAMVAVMIRVRPRAALVAAISFTVGLSILGKVALWDPAVHFWFDALNGIPVAAREQVPEEQIYYDLENLNPLARSHYEFRIAPRRMIFVDDVCVPPIGSLVITSIPSEAESESVSLVAFDERPNQALVRLDSLSDLEC